VVLRLFLSAPFNGEKAAGEVPGQWSTRAIVMVPLRVLFAYEHSVLNETFKAAHPIYLGWLMCDIVYLTETLPRVLRHKPTDEPLF
jgi:hypothetical protein